MLETLKEEVNKIYTENMAVTRLSALSGCLGLFATIGVTNELSFENI